MVFKGMNHRQPNAIEAKLTPDSPLFDIVEKAYRVFAYPKPKSTGVCKHCCMYPEIEKDFFNPAIRELPLRYVRDWYSAAYDPKGVPKETWAYLLPRLLEILAAGEGVSDTAIEVSLSRFETGNRQNWSQEEWEVLDNFQRTYLRHRIEQGDDPLDDILCMFSLAGWELRGMLNQVSSTSDKVLVQRLWNDWCRGCIPGREDIWVTAFWEGRGNSGAHGFYTSKVLYDRIAALALADDTDADLAAKAAAVAMVIERARV